LRRVISNCGRFINPAKAMHLITAALSGGFLKYFQKPLFKMNYEQRFDY
jgi:hypothetical protein